MIPPELSFDDLAAQLADDGIAVRGPGVNDPIWQHSLRQAVNDVTGGPRDMGVVVLDITPSHADMRDTAHDLAHAVGFDTVVVRAPDGAAAVSRDFSRFAVEKAEAAMLDASDYAQGIRDFGTTLSDTHIPWLGVTATICIVCAAAALAMFPSRNKR